MTTKTIVVFGATGVQGTGLIEALSKHNVPTIQYNILALTRNPSGGSAKRLTSNPGVTAVQVADNCMDEPDKVFAAIEGPVYGVVSIQGYVDDKTMTTQGKAIADAAVKAGAKHIVYSSTECGGNEDSAIPGFKIKLDVEKYIKTLPIGHTFLRPVQFMDNYLPTAPFPLKIGRTVTLRYAFKTHPERKHQLISARDIGRAGAKAFVEGPQWMGGVVPLAGDALLAKDIEAVYKKVYGTNIELVNGLLARFVKLMIPIVKDLNKFFDEVGYAADLNECERELPGMETLEAFFVRNKQ